MTRNIEDPVTVENKKWPGGDATTTTHPAFGQISISKPQGTIDLYGSDFTHHHFVNLEIHESELNRDLSRDWTFARKLLVSVSLSEAQWATFVLSFGCSEGVPCTIEYADGESRPSLPPRETWKLYREEAEQSFSDALSKVKDLRSQIVAAASRLPKKAQADLTAPIDAVINSLQSTLPFIKESFDKHIEDSIEKAKVEVNAYATQRAPRLYDAGFLAFIRRKPCCVCGRAAPSEAAHIRMGITGMGRKPDDAKAVPLCSWCHREGPEAQHKGSEQAFWDRYEIDPFAFAAKLYAEYGGDGGKPRKRTTIKPRLPREKRAKIQGRNTFR